VHGTARQCWYAALDRDTLAAFTAPMHSRPLRFLLVVACACGISAAAVFINSLETPL